jgi:DNA transposition AAA+ family ATPase
MDGEDAPFVATAATDRVMGALSTAHRCGYLISIEGPPGVGKTTAALRYMDENPGRVWYYAARPDTAAIGPLFRDLSRCVAGVVDTRVGENRNSITKAAAWIRAPMLILDEAQNFNGASLEAIRSLHDDGALFAIALMGNQTYTDRHGVARNWIAKSVAHSPQFQSRLDMTVELTGAPADDVGAVARAHGIADRTIAGRMAMIARGPKGLRIVEDVARLAAELAEGRAPTSADFDAALHVLQP